MQTSRTSAKSRIEQLVRYFEQNIRQLMLPSFNETQARQQLIDPFFEALGWDVTNRSMKPLYLQEVMPEGRVKTSSEVHDTPSLFETKQTLGKDYKEYASILDYIAEDNYKASAKEAIKKPDYRFRIKGQTKFFVEAKKPFVDLAKSQDAIFQVKRYGFSGRVPVSILTDFEEFRVFDCTHKPLFEKPRLGVIKVLDLRFGQYLDKFDLLYDTFAREAVESGSLDSLTKSLMKKRTGDFALDKAFLEDLSRWREELARDIAKHPKNRRLLNDLTLNESVQRILDRIVFFRVCEDREIEVENTLLALVRLWKERPGVSLYALLTDLFKKRRELYNGLLFSPHECEQLEVSDKIILTILENLNYPFSPYHFSEIGVEILGSIYEKFLGKTIHLTAKTVRVDEKPEVRKAGGVYYTPQYIVEYIVNNTVGKLIEGKTPTQIAKLKVIDIACGSGSFLLGAFQKLIDYHVEWYTKNPNTIKTVSNIPDAYKDANGDMRLSSRKKRDILVNNIYGVDIDRQAVEVTQMSLYLKVLEGENAETLNPQMMLALKEVYLPSLADNIKCGNSLIGTDFASQEDMFENASAQMINAFDWGTEFADIMNAGGFDCVIGNPPYIPIEMMSTDQKDYSQKRFPQLQRKYDSSVVFILTGLEKLKRNGRLGFISSVTWQTGENYAMLRKFLIEKKAVETLVNLPFDVFPDAYVDTGVYILSAQQSNEYKIFRFPKKQEVESLDHLQYSTVPFTVLSPPEYKIVLNSDATNILKHISSSKNTIPFGDVSISTQGLAGNMFETLKKPKNKVSYKYLQKGQVHRYGLRVDETAYTDMTEKESLRKFYEAEPKLLIRRVISRQDRILAAHCEDQLVFKKDINPFLLTNKEYSSLYVLGIVNSKLISFLYINTSSIATKDDFRQTTLAELRRLPIRTIDVTNPAEKKMHDEMVTLVEKMLDLNKQLQKANFDSEREPIERRIAATDKKIDQLVYQLYDLTAEEIRIVEGEK